MGSKGRPPIFARSIFANLEIFAVFGIFGLYALEFAGIHSFSQLIPEQLRDDTVNVGGLSLLGGSTDVSIVQLYTGLIVTGIIILLIVIRRRRK